jgi:hypothetical protein
MRHLYTLGIFLGKTLPYDVSDYYTLFCEIATLFFIENFYNKAF